jgi:hypothetical protein
MPALLDLTGQRFGRLVVATRGGTVRGHAGWNALCDCGNTLIVSGYKLRTGHTKSCGCLRAEVTGSLRRSDVVGYHGAHQRLGPAKNHQCIDCGAQARSWSYDRQDPDELLGDRGTAKGLAYSLNPSHYHPRCKDCHAAFDAPSRKV